MEGKEFLEFVQGKQSAGGWFSIAVKDHEDHWEERFYEQVPDFELDLFATYFSVNRYIETKRGNDYCLPGRWLWQDLDETTPDYCESQGWPPSLYWESSPNRYQGLWLLKYPIPPERLAVFNKALNRRVNADKGTWNLSRVLRVPGSYNGKRDCQVGSAIEYTAALA